MSNQICPRCPFLDTCPAASTSPFTSAKELLTQEEPEDFQPATQLHAMNHRLRRLNPCLEARKHGQKTTVDNERIRYG